MPTGGRASGSEKVFAAASDEATPAQASIDLRHAPFAFWITDLSAPEDLFSIAGLPIRPLPLLMGVTMVLQQRLMPSAGADAQQRQMMTMMSVAFIFLFYHFFRWN